MEKQLTNFSGFMELSWKMNEEYGSTNDFYGSENILYDTLIM